MFNAVASESASTRAGLSLLRKLALFNNKPKQTKAEQLVMTKKCHSTSEKSINA